MLFFQKKNKGFYRIFSLFSIISCLQCHLWVLINWLKPIKCFGNVAKIEIIWKEIYLEKRRDAHSVWLYVEHLTAMGRRIKDLFLNSSSKQSLKCDEERKKKLERTCKHFVTTRRLLASNFWPLKMVIKERNMVLQFNMPLPNTQYLKVALVLVIHVIDQLLDLPLKHW